MQQIWTNGAARAPRLRPLPRSPRRLRPNGVRPPGAAGAGRTAPGRKPGAGRAPIAGREAVLVEARWLVEELRVSLFAQTLGTSRKVSLQRIGKLLAKA